MSLTLGTYGVTSAVRGPAGAGGGLAGAGLEQQTMANNTLSAAADQETQRNIQNQKMEQEAKAGKAQLGSTVGGLAGGALAGAQFGAAAGPWGMLIGGALGAIAGGLF